MCVVPQPFTSSPARGQNFRKDAARVSGSHIFDHDLQLVQARAFFGSLDACSARDGVVVVAGRTSDKPADLQANPVHQVKALQGWSKDVDGWFAVLRRR